MREALWLHTMTHLRFFARSRLLLGLALVLGGVWSAGLVAFLLLESSSDRFEMLKTIADQVRWFAWFYTAAMGLFALWWHTTQRTTSLVFTRPGRPEIWLGSVFLSAFLAAFTIHAAGFLLTVGLSLAWGLPFQSGFVWLSLDGLIESVIIVSVLAGVALVVHPVIAVLMLVFFSEGMLRWLDVTLLAYLEANGASTSLAVLEKTIRAVYLTLPMLDPFEDRTQAVAASVRASAADWAYLGGAAAYALLVFLFWYLFAAWRLRRRALA